MMDRAIALHHSCFRKLIVKHTGYEAQVEGDSFCVAFHNTRDAATFCMAIQVCLCVCVHACMRARTHLIACVLLVCVVMCVLGGGSLACCLCSLFACTSPSCTANNASDLLHAGYLVNDGLAAAAIGNAGMQASLHVQNVSRERGGMFSLVLGPCGCGGGGGGGGVEGPNGAA